MVEVVRWREMRQVGPEFFFTHLLPIVLDMATWTAVHGTTVLSAHNGTLGPILEDLIQISTYNYHLFNGRILLSPVVRSSQKLPIFARTERGSPGFVFRHQTVR